MKEHYVLRSVTYSTSEMFVVRDVLDKPARSWNHDKTEEEWPKLLRVDWLTPDGWIPGEEGGRPPLYGPWSLLPGFTEALIGEPRKERNGPSESV